MLLRSNGTPYEDADLGLPRSKALNPNQQQPNTASANNPGPHHSTEPIPFPVIQPAAQTSHTETDTYQEKNYKLQKRGTLIQGLLCVFTGLAFFAAAYYAYLTKVQTGLVALTLQSNTRAFLAAGPPHQDEPGRQQIIRVPISNQGHLPSQWLAIRIVDLRDRISIDHGKVANTELQNITWQIPVNRVYIEPGATSFTLVINPETLSLSDLAEVESGKQQEKLSVVAGYDIGFPTPPDVFVACLEYAPKQNRWASCGNGLTVINLDTEPRNHHKTTQ